MPHQLGTPTYEDMTVDLGALTGTGPLRESAEIRETVYLALQQGRLLKARFGYDLPCFPAKRLHEDEYQHVNLNPVRMVCANEQLYVLHAAPGCEFLLLGLHRMVDVELLNDNALQVEPEAILAYLSGFDLRRYRSPEAQIADLQMQRLIEQAMEQTSDKP